MARPTTTSAFGVSRREGHDATPFYRRFVPPETSGDERVADHRALDKLMVGDSRHMEEVPDASVALVVTSPPYFAGKEYEQALGRSGVPGSYLEYLELLRDVFAECARKLEPGGRLAVNVANLGRRPYRSLSADLIGILQDDLRLLLRGEIIWVKQKGASGSCAWGSFQSPANPVLRDLTERVVVASKGRFDRAVPAAGRARRGLPCEATMTRDDFMEGTLDVWTLPPESATRVGHPAPFPLELPARLIELYTYRGDLVLDPFVGSGTTAVAALRAGRHYAGYDTDEGYLRRAEARIEAERARLPGLDGPGPRLGPGLGPGPGPGQAGRAGLEPDGLECAGRAGLEPDGLAGLLAAGRSARQVAEAAVTSAGWADLRPGKPPGPDFTAAGPDGRRVGFRVAGGHTTHRPGLQRSEVLWRVVGESAATHHAGGLRQVVLSTGVPRRGPLADALAAVTGPGRPVWAVIDLTDPAAVGVLAVLASRAG